jgi:hypothetical protein
MSEREAAISVLLFSAFMVLTTCQLQFNKSTGSSLALQVVIPGTASSGTRGTPAVGANGKDIAGGASLAVTITPPQGAAQTLSAPINGKTSVDFSFNLFSSGTYQITAQMLDGSGNLLSTASTQANVPMGNYPVVLTMPSNLLTAVLTEVSDGFQYLPPFNPTTYDYAFFNLNLGAYTLALTTVDSNATLAVTVNGSAVSPTGSTYTFNLSNINTTYTVIIVVTAADGTTKATYTITLRTHGG